MFAGGTILDFVTYFIFAWCSRVIFIASSGIQPNNGKLYIIRSLNRFAKFFNADFQDRAKLLFASWLMGMERNPLFFERLVYGAAVAADAALFLATGNYPIALLALYLYTIAHFSICDVLKQKDYWSFDQKPVQTHWRLSIRYSIFALTLTILFVLSFSIALGKVLPIEIAQAVAAALLCLFSWLGSRPSSKALREIQQDDEDEDFEDEDFENEGEDHEDKSDIDGAAILKTLLAVDEQKRFGAYRRLSIREDTILYISIVACVAGGLLTLLQFDLWVVFFTMAVTLLITAFAKPINRLCSRLRHWILWKIEIHPFSRSGKKQMAKLRKKVPYKSYTQEKLFAEHRMETLYVMLQYWSQKYGEYFQLDSNNKVKFHAYDMSYRCFSPLRKDVFQKELPTEAFLEILDAMMELCFAWMDPHNQINDLHLLMGPIYENEKEKRAAYCCSISFYGIIPPEVISHVGELGYGKEGDRLAYILDMLTRSNYGTIHIRNSPSDRYININIIRIFFSGSGKCQNVLLSNDTQICGSNPYGFICQRDQMLWKTED